jgi:methyltransferase (TIGR00027 family)
MERADNIENKFFETNKTFMEIAGPGSKTAMGVLLNRFTESRKPENERICYDPYAVHFVSRDILDLADRKPDEARAMHAQYERFLPGLSNSIVARVRFFDDFVKKSIEEGILQLVILGAGYDSRAYRIERLKKMNVFEVDHPATQAVKMKKIKEIFGGLPDYVVYVPVDLGAEDLGQKLQEMGYDRSLKTLVLMEGLLYYLPPKAVDEILFFIVKNSGRGSSVLFDYYPQSVVDGNSPLEAGRNVWNHVSQLGEPFQFGIKEGTIESFLVKRGFSQVRNVTSEDYKEAYFHGINENRAVFSLLSFAHAAKE